ncbi:redoxin domain-containing protein [Pseudothermotoga thermarum]|uniref:Alkyl hydroperoxide reductase/ Thiol specific antioxidant/ Mal allergen n=1 Tax=Pseudothermotoga thermarum DSM 5069 TaxID=688269 RepID=F7YUT2_9THEM|nr:redoxin domain-containing protein [Pseudothermotoga thermarum]AEH50271.1 alkyl hydroperoxide reductase/ Thiol specific antioxidant/ Mal allergen [Pseudothermotoga thermarum DSM 5069]
MKTIPEFVLKDAYGKEFSYKNLFGDYWVIYFYPKAGTPGCSMEAIDFTSHIEEFEGKVVGISPDKQPALCRFIDSRKLKVILLSDPDKAVAGKFGVVENGKIVRSTFIVDPLGRIRKSWLKVKVPGHVKEVLEEFKRIKQEDKQISPDILARRAYRGLRSDPIPKEDLIRLIEAAHLAPSCFNNQPWRYIIVTDKQTLEKLWESLTSGNYWMKNAPAMIVVYTKEDFDCKLSDNRNYALFDTGLSVGFLMVQATRMNLVAHPVAGYDPLKVKEIFGIDGIVITLIAVGKRGNFDSLNEKHLEREFGERQREPFEKILKIF